MHLLANGEAVDRMEQVILSRLACHPEKCCESGEKAKVVKPELLGSFVRHMRFAKCFRTEVGNSNDA